MAEFLQKFQELVKEQEREVEKAVIGRGASLNYEGSISPGMCRR